MSNGIEKLMIEKMKEIHKQAVDGVINFGPDSSINKSDSMDWPRCDVCDKPCDGAATENFLGGYLMIAMCHKDYQAIYVDQKEFFAKGSKICWGPAFHKGGEPLVRNVGKGGEHIKYREGIDPWVN